MEEAVSVPEVLYETRYHASSPYSSNYPPLQRINEGDKGSLLSLLSTRAVSHLKEKWAGYKHPQKLRKWISLFVSPRGERVAVAVGNQITILQKDNDYQEPCGLFTSSCRVTFICGSWSEGHDVLGVADDSDALYFLKANGEEITRIRKSHLKVSLPIVSLMIQDDSILNKSCLCTFRIMTSDGSFHDIEISRDPSASISTARSSKIGSVVKQFPQNIFCLAYHPGSSLLAVVSGGASISSSSGHSTGSYSLSLWEWTRESDLTAVVSTQFEGVYSKPKCYAGGFTFPKALFSPQGEFVGTLDLRGRLIIFKLSADEYPLSVFCSGESYNLDNIVDFTWWSDSILTIADRSGCITMLDIVSGVKVLGNDPVYSMPILERIPQFPKHIFLLESRSSDESFESSELLLMEAVTVENCKRFDNARLRWRLISFAERSVPEMYNVLIGSQKYQAALDFSERHHLEKDEVLKAQWLHSVQGMSEINTLELGQQKMQSGLCLLTGSA